MHGKPFAAVLRLNAENKVEFDFGQDEIGPDGNKVEVDFTGQEPVGLCPKCRQRVFEAGMAYVCERSVGPSRTCDFRTGKIILQQPVEREQMQKLLATGRTELLKEFVSARTRRKFSAFLVRGKDGKVGFEFEPRAPKAAAKKPATKAAKAEEPTAETPAKARKAPAKRKTKEA